LDRELGRGAFGVVYRAHHADRPETPLAVKVVENRGNLDRLLLEPALLAKLDHPGIVHLKEYFLQEDRLILALEFIGGDNLQTCLDGGERFDPSQVRDLLAQLANALAHAHANQVIHRDLKLSNILVERDGDRLRYVLTDFGIGLRTEGIQTRKHTGGTFAFMAPEQLRGRPVPQSDLWALGVVAYRLLTGELPFTGQTLPELSDQIHYAAPVAPSQCSTQPIDAELETIVLHLLEKSLSNRTATASDLLRELGHSAKPVTPVSPAKKTGGSSPTSQAVLEKRLQRQLSRYKVLVGVLASLYLLQGGLGHAALLLVALFVFYRIQSRERWATVRGALALAGALVLLLLGLVLSWSGHDVNLAKVGITIVTWMSGSVQDPNASYGPVEMGVVAFLAVGFYLLPPLMAYYYGRVRRSLRAQALRRAALESTSEPERYLAAMKDFLDYRFEDVSFHLRYAEALWARGRIKDVAVEARLLLEQDPYNFTGNLLLANAYFTLGLRRECLAVCDHYLAVTGYCFEFTDLGQQCSDQLRRPA
jgi:serine/threonine-protein kinase